MAAAVASRWRHLALVAGCLAALAACENTREGGAGEDGEPAAAVVIRDDVTPFQKWGSRQFTELHLDHYASWSYLTEEPEDGPAGKRAALAQAIEAAAARHGAVDLYLLAHGSGRYLRVVEGLSPSARSRLRIVYDTGAGGSSLGPRWIAAGARAHVGHPGSNLAPLFYWHFLPRLLEGVPVSQAVADANERTREAILEGASGAVVRQGGDLGAGPISPEELWAGTRAVVAGDGATAVRPAP